MTASLHTLAERVEAASGADRELDAEIALASGWSTFATPHDAVTGSEIAWGLGGVLGGITGHWRPAPLEYTASLDAAMTLVPEGWTYFFVELARIGTGNDAAKAEISRLVNEEEEWCAAHAATPALALCAASLRALAAQGEAGAPGEAA